MTQAGLEHGSPPASASKTVGILACVTTHSGELTDLEKVNTRGEECCPAVLGQRSFLACCSGSCVHGRVLESCVPFRPLTYLELGLWLSGMTSAQFMVPSPTREEN